jgi:mercuric ion binding protein
MRKFLLICILGFVAAAGEKTATIHIEGMTCPLCTTAIKKSLKKIDGVSQAKVILNTKQATVCFSDEVTAQQLLDAIKDAGYSGTIEEIKPE